MWLMVTETSTRRLLSVTTRNLVMSWGELHSTDGIECDEGGRGRDMDPNDLCPPLPSRNDVNYPEETKLKELRASKV